MGAYKYSKAAINSKLYYLYYQIIIIIPNLQTENKIKENKIK